MADIPRVKDAGTWKLVKDIKVKQAGAWKTVKQAWVKQAGVWKRFFAAGVLLSYPTSLWGQDFGSGPETAQISVPNNAVQFQGRFISLIAMGCVYQRDSNNIPIRADYWESVLNFYGSPGAPTSAQIRVTNLTTGVSIVMNQVPIFGGYSLRITNSGGAFPPNPWVNFIRQNQTDLFRCEQI